MLAEAELEKVIKYETVSNHVEIIGKKLGFKF
jgi:hypothetical protein